MSDAPDDPAPGLAPPPRRGRPRVETPLVSVSLTLPAPVVDHLAQIAVRQGVTLSATLRRVVLLSLQAGDDAPAPLSAKLLLGQGGPNWVEIRKRAGRHVF